MALNTRAALLVKKSLDFYDKTKRFIDAIAAPNALEGTDSADYGWIDRLPGFREFKGERLVSGISDKSYIVVTGEYDETVEVPAKDWRFGRLFNANTLMAEMGADAAKFPDLQVAEVLKNGETLTTFDGVALFSRVHDDGLGSLDQANLISGTGVTVTCLCTDWDSACEAMMGLQLGLTGPDDARKLGVRPNAVMVKTVAMERKFKTIFGSDKIGAVTNTYKGDIPLENIYLNPDLDVDADWFAFHKSDTGVKPLLYQFITGLGGGEGESKIVAMKDGLEISYLGPETEHAFWKKSIVFGATLLIKVAPWFWPYIIKVDAQS